MVLGAHLEEARQGERSLVRHRPRRVALGLVSRWLGVGRDIICENPSHPFRLLAHLTHQRLCQVDQAPRAAAHGGAEEDTVVDVDEQRGGLAAVLLPDAVEELEGDVALLRVRVFVCVRVVWLVWVCHKRANQNHFRETRKRTSSFSMTALRTTQARRRDSLLPSTSRPSEP